MDKQEDNLSKLTNIDKLSETFNYFIKLENIDLSKLEVFLQEAGFAYEILQIVSTNMILVATKSIDPLRSLQTYIEQKGARTWLSSKVQDLISNESLETLSSKPNLLAPGSEVVLTRQQGVKARIVKVVGEYALVELNHQNWLYHSHVPLSQIQLKYP